MKLFNSIRVVRLLCRIAILEILRTFRLHKSRLVSIAFHRNILIGAWRFGCQTSQQGLCPLPTRCGHNPQASFAPPLSTRSFGSATARVVGARDVSNKRLRYCRERAPCLRVGVRVQVVSGSWAHTRLRTQIPNSDFDQWAALPTLVRYCSWCH